MKDPIFSNFFLEHFYRDVSVIFTHSTFILYNNVTKITGYLAFIKCFCSVQEHPIYQLCLRSWNFFCEQKIVPNRRVVNLSVQNNSVVFFF